MNKITRLLHELIREGRVTVPEGLAISAAVDHVQTFDPYSTFTRTYGTICVDEINKLCKEETPQT